jgi:type VI secretion system protein ImpK
LSVRWQPAVGRASAFGTWLPLWVGTFVVAALLAVLYFSLMLGLALQSDRVFAQIAALRLPAPVKANASPAPAPQPRLLPLLSTAASPGLQVRDEIDRSIITLSDEALFEAATANLLRAGADSLRPLAAALQGTAGQVLILGHTDSRSERSARFPSNWELSVERARAVRDALLLFGVPPTRIRYDGRADSEPLTSAGANQAPVHSGRIEIVLLAGR